jgi:hypothetical protein
MEPPVRYAHPPEPVMPRVPQRLLPRRRQQFRYSPGLTNTMPVPAIQPVRASDARQLLKISGFVAWLMWRGLYLLRIPALARKSRLFLEWNWAMFFPPDISHFGYRRSQRRNSRTMPSGETSVSAPAPEPMQPHPMPAGTRAR